MASQPHRSPRGAYSDEDMRKSLDRANKILDASKLLLVKAPQRRHKEPLDISNMFGQKSFILPAEQTPERRSLSPISSQHPVCLQSTRKSIESDLAEHIPRSNIRSRGSTTAYDLANRSGARAVAANLNGTTDPINVRELSVNQLLAGSRSERVRRLSQAPAAAAALPPPPALKTKKKDRVLQMFESDEQNFLAEIPMNFQPSSPPVCEKRSNNNSNNVPQQKYMDAARIPIELDDFGGEGYLLSNDLSFNAMCNKMSNRTDSICLPMEETQQEKRRHSGNQRKAPTMDSFFDEKLETIILDTDDDAKENRSTAFKRTINNTHNGKLLGGDMEMDGNNDCLDCPQQCKCAAENSGSPKKKQKSGEQSQKDTCKRETKKNMDYCDQHLSYLDRVMKHLDLKADSSVCNSRNKSKNVSSDCCAEKQEQGQARKAKSMVSSDCCPGVSSADPSSVSRAFVEQFYNNQQECSNGGGPKLSEANSCCSEDLGKAMSLCSQQFSGRDENFKDAGSLPRATSSMSEFNFVTGYLPLKSTHNELSWHSVKLRKTATKTFQIKNTSAKRLIIRVILDGPGFNFETTEANGRGTVTLQPNEVRTLSLIFNPTVLGPAIGNLIFQPPIEFCAAGGGCATMSNINSKVTKRVVRLYGYGGHVAMSYERLQQGPVGNKFLPLGNLCNLSKVFEETFIIRNKGNLTGFAAVMLENKTVGKSMFDRAISICPDKVLIPPNSAVKIKVSFQPSNADMKEMLKIHRNQEVIAVGNILVVTGDEPTRCRIKRLMKDSKELADKYSSAQLKNIWADFGARDCDYDLAELRETGMAVADLIGSFISKEVALTVNNSTTDMSLIDASGWISDVEDTDALFHSICQPNDDSGCCRVPPGGDVGMMPLAAAIKCEPKEDPCNPDEWHVQPGSLNFVTNSALPEVLTIYSKVSKDRMFEVDSNVANYFCVSPQEGVLTPSCARTNISVRMMNYNVPPCPLFIYIYIENDRICVPVQVERGPPEGTPTCNKITQAKLKNLA